MPDLLLIVIVGATGVGKSAVAVELAERVACTGVDLIESGCRSYRAGVPILSCDSRQFYREMSIGTAVPTAAERAAVPHYFIQDRSVDVPYNAGMFEQDALELLADIFSGQSDHSFASGEKRVNCAIMVGGSGMYVDAVCKGFDDLPDSSPELRNSLNEKSLSELLRMLSGLDPVYYAQVDHGNRHRVQRAVEVCITASTIAAAIGPLADEEGERGGGSPVTYSDLRTHSAKSRPFRIVKVGISLPREVLYDRINARVDQMMEDGLLLEARKLYSRRQLSALQTVGYRELFDYFDGKISLEDAVSLIKRNSRRYAKRQLTWFRRDSDIRWFEPSQIDNIVEYITTLTR